MKKLGIGLLLSCMLFVLYFIVYSSIYKIANNNEAIISYINDVNHEDKAPFTPIKDIVSLTNIGNSNKWVAKFEYEDGTFGSANFSKGWNKKFKGIDVSNQPPMTYSIIETNKGPFGIVSGLNTDGEISKIKILTADQTEYSIDVSEEILFMHIEKLSNDPYAMQPIKYVFYDKDNHVIFSSS